MITQNIQVSLGLTYQQHCTRMVYMFHMVSCQAYLEVHLQAIQDVAISQGKFISHLLIFQ